MLRKSLVLILTPLLLLAQGSPAWAGHRERWKRYERLFSSLSSEKKLPGHRMLFVWNNWFRDGNDTLSYPERRKELLDFCSSKEIEILFLNSEGVVYGDAEDVKNFRRFIREARRRGMLVFGLQGNPWWAVPAGSRVAGQTNNSEIGWLYLKRVAEFGMFDGMIDDTEPYLANTNDWWASTEQRSQWYLDWLKGAKRVLGDRMPFWATIPFWYDQDGRTAALKLDGSSAPRPLNQYVSDVVDVVNIMDYRDFSDGSDGLVFHSDGEMRYGPTVIGVETQCLGLGRIADKQSFCEEGNAVMEGELSKVHDVYGDSPNFKGFSIHYYESYQSLPP